MSHPDGVNGSVYSLGQDSSNRLIAGGLFTTAGGQSSKGLARFFPDGTRDPSFDIGDGVAGGTYNYVADLLVLPDDSIIVVGDFGSFDGTTRGNIARIKTDGSVDPNFAAGVGADAMIRHIEHSGDGGYIIGGNFSNYDGVTRSRLAKLNSDGSLDLTFTFDHTLASGDWVDQIEVFADGSILVAGECSPYNVRRFLADGTTDTTFLYDFHNNTYVEATLLASDGKILIGGEGGLRRHNADGTFDSSFQPQLHGNGGSEIYGLKELDDGRIVATGSFLTAGAIDTWNIVVLNADGTVDTTAIPDQFRPNGWVGPTLLQGDRLIFAGQFSQISENDSPSSLSRIARINTNPVSNSTGAVYFNKNEVTIIEGADYRQLNISLIRESILEEHVDVDLELVLDTPLLPDPQLNFTNSASIDGTDLSQDLSISNHTNDNDYYTGNRVMTYRITSVNSGSIGEPSEIRVTLVDDEPHPNVRFASDTIEVTEGQYIEDALEILYDSQPEDYADYRIVVDSENKDLEQSIRIMNDSFYLGQEQIYTSDLDVHDDDDQLTGPIEIPLRLIAFDPTDAQFLGDNATTTLRILDNEVANSIRFDNSQMAFVTDQEEIEIPISYEGSLQFTLLEFEIEVDDPAWEESIYLNTDQYHVSGSDSLQLYISHGNSTPLPSTTGRIRMLTDQGELIGDPSTLELTLYDHRTLDGWKFLQYPETHIDPNLLSLDTDGDGQTTLLEWLNDSDPNDVTDHKLLKTYLEQIEPEAAPYFVTRFYYNAEKSDYAVILEHKTNLTDINWSPIWRSDNDPEFQSELFIQPPTGNLLVWPEIRLPSPVGTSGFVRIRYEESAAE